VLQGYYQYWQQKDMFHEIEEPAGDMMRSIGPMRSPDMAAYFLNINRNKQSVVLDLKRPAAQAALLRLAAGADVLVHNMRPGAAERCGIDYTAVSAANPRIVYAWASGYRPDGPNRDRAAFDDVIQGESGFAALNADSDGSPRYAPMVIGDKLCGYVLASMVGMALYAREKTGKGQEVHVPMFDTMAAFNLVDHLWHGVFGFRRSATEVTYIYDVNQDLKRLRGIMDKAAHDPVIQINPALWPSLEMT